MSTDPDFDEALREAGQRIGEIIRDDQERQRREIHDKIRALLQVARTKVGGEFAEALLQVLVVADKWQAEAAEVAVPVLDPYRAADDILTAIETGLGVRTS